MLKINIKTIPHKEQRYQTSGDWWFDSDENLEIRVSDMKNPVYEWLIAEHEINEALRCKKDGIDEKTVYDFDVAFEELRKKYPDVIGKQEPGDMENAPYRKQHTGASNIEMLSCSFHGEDWKKYNDEVEKL